MRLLYCLLVCAGITIGFPSCSSYDKVLKSTDVNYKLTKANEYYDRKKYFQANELYHNLIPVLRGTRNYEPLYYRYAYSFFYQKDYYNASYHFKNFVDFFPTSKDADEAEFMHAVALFKMSPKASLEQTNTIKAMEALQSYVNTHTDSGRIAQANAYLDEGRKKIEQKEGGAAKLYYNMGQYKAAAITYKSLFDTYPDSPIGDYYLLMVIKSYYKYAQQSVESRQEERYAQVSTAYETLKSQYPSSPLLKEGEQFVTSAANKITSLRK